MANKAKFNAQKSNAMITGLIASIVATGNAFIAHVQDALCAGILHARETGDATPLLRVVQAMPKSNRRELATGFISRYSPVRVLPNADNGKGKCGLLKEGDKTFKPFDYDAAVKASWTDGAEAADAKALDLLAADKMIYALASRIEKGADGANDNDKKVILERVTALRAMAKTVAAAA